MAREPRSGSLVVISNGSLAICDDGRRFINSHTGELLVDLKRRGFNPIYLAPPEPYDPSGNLHNFELGAHGVPSRLWNLQGKFRALAELPGVITMLSRASAVYIFFPGKLGVLVALLCRILGKKYGLYVRGSKFASGHIGRGVLRSAAFALTVSPSLENVLRGYCCHVETIRPMLDLNTHDCATRSENRTQGRCRQLLFVGRLEVDKGIHELIAATKSLDFIGFDYQLRIVGGGPLHSWIAEGLGSGSVSPNVVLVGPIDDKRELMGEYEAADYFILPTYHEGFPRVLYEAMIKSTPIVTTMVGGIPGRMRDGENCIGIPVGDADAIADAVLRLSGDPQLAMDLGAAGLRTVMATLSNNRTHIELIEEALARLCGVNGNAR